MNFIYAKLKHTTNIHEPENELDQSRMISRFLEKAHLVGHKLFDDSFSPRLAAGSCFADLVIQQTQPKSLRNLEDGSLIRHIQANMAFQKDIVEKINEGDGISPNIQPDCGYYRGSLPGDRWILA
jgi:hypothetical protein